MSSSRRAGFGPVGFLLVVFVLVALNRSQAGGDPQLAGLVGGFALAALAVGVAAPMVRAARIRATVTSPADATVGEVVDLGVTVRRAGRRTEVRVLDPAGPWFRVPADGAGRLPHAALQRGVFRFVRLEVQASGPLGVRAHRRTIEVDLGHVVHVAPRPAPQGWMPTPVSRERVVPAAPPVPTPGDAVRSVRPYVAGDPARHVHWPTSARTGTLVVKELEAPASAGVAVVLHLDAPGDAAERAASEAAGLVRAVLGSGGTVLLATHQAGGPVLAPVRSARAAGRRLAAAVPGEPLAPPPGWPVREIR